MSHSRSWHIAAVRVDAHIAGRTVVAGGAHHRGVFVPGILLVPYPPAARRGQARGLPRPGSRHRRPWLHTPRPHRSWRITRNTDARNRFERHGNRAGVAARGRNPPVWCDRMNGVLLTALSGSQPLWIRGRRRFRRGNPLTEMARTIPDRHIFAILLRLARPRRACERSESARQR